MSKNKRNSTYALLRGLRARRRRNRQLDDKRRTDVDFALDLDRATVLLHNDRQLTESAWLKSGDNLRSGELVVRYERSGDRIVFSVVEERASDSPVLSPPSHPPPGVAPQNNGASELPVDIASPTTTSGKKKLAASMVG